MKIFQKRENHIKMQAKNHKDTLGTLQILIRSKKTHKNHKDTEGTLQNMNILRKILYPTLAKISKISEIHEKSAKLHRTNRKDTEGTLQNRVKIYKNHAKS